MGRPDRNTTLVGRFLHRYARRNVPQYAVGTLMLLATNWVVVRIPALIGEALNLLEAAGPSAVADAQGIATELVLLGAVLVVVRTLSRVLFFNPGRDVEFHLGLDLFGHLLALQRPYFMRHKIGELVSLASNDTTAVRLLVGFVGLQLFNVAVAVPLHLYQMVRTDPVLTGWCVIPLVAGAFYLRITIRAFFDMVRHSMVLLAQLSDRVLESYAGIGTIRAYAGEEATVEHFERLNREYLDLQLRVATIRAFGMPVLGLAGLVGTAIVLWVGGERVIAGETPIGDIATFSALLVSLVTILTGLAWVLAAVSRGIVSLRRIDAVLQTENDLPPVCTDRVIEAPPRLELRGLSFTYPGSAEPVLHGLDVVVPPGSTLGIFGKTGSGKTTLIELLCRLHTPPPGTIFLDGVDLRDYDLDALRQGMAVVPQSNYLFSTSLRENIALRADAGLDPKLDRALEAVALREDVSALADGVETIVGERGVMLSGGQRQRAALARALYLERPLLLLDDVLSAVDQGTELKLVEAIRGLRSTGNATPTTVIVSHRTSVLEHADEIIVLQNGRIAERGRHAELLARGGEYAQTHLHQQVEQERA